MEITVEFSAYLAMKTGERKTTAAVKAGGSIRDLLRLLCLRYGKIAEDLFFVDNEGLAVMTFVNKRHKNGDYILQENDHVIFLLPVTGG